MSLSDIIFYFFILSAVAGAVGLIFSKNVFYAALLVIITLLSLAALFVLNFAEFVAVTQILVYAGGILVVIIFGIMLTSKYGTKPLNVQHSNIFSGLAVAVPLLILLLFNFNDYMPEAGTGVSPLETHPDTIQAIGISLMSRHVLVFEVAGVLLLIALIGAAVIATTKPAEIK